MARAAKLAAIKRITGEDSDDEHESDLSVIDDIYEDVFDEPMIDADEYEFESIKESDSEGEMESEEDSYEGVYFGRNGTKWEVIDENLATPGRSMRQNILHPAPGLTSYAYQRIREDPILDSFFIFFSNDMIETIMRETNRQGRKTFGENYKPVDVIEMKAFLGLLLLRGVYRSSGECTDELWSPLHGRPIFSKTMSLNRFKLIRGILRFDNVDTRQSRLARDKLAAVRLLLDSFVDHSQLAYVPNASITVDEQLYPYRGRCRCRQYMPSKPAKYGFKFWVACDSDNYYCCNIQFYCGKDDDRDASVPLGEHVVLTLTEHLRQSGRNVTCDNFFTSLSLAKKLYDRNMTMVGTIRANRRELPNVLAFHRKRELYSTIQAVNQTDDCNTLLVSYMAKKDRVVNILSTTHKKTVIDNSTENKKPDVVVYYNSTKGGVDAVDERVGTYSVKFKCRRWHVPFFCNILDLSAYNGFVIHSIYDPEWNNRKLHRRRLYLLELGNALLRQHIERRQVHHSLSKSVSIPSLLNPHDDRKRGVCVECCIGERKKCSTRCDGCHVFVCKEHSQQLCNTCANNRCS